MVDQAAAAAAAAAAASAAANKLIQHDGPFQSSCRLLLTPETLQVLQTIWTRLDPHLKGFLTVVDFTHKPAGSVDPVWPQVLLNFDYNGDMVVSVDEFIFGFINVALADGMPIQSFAGSGLELLAAFGTTLNMRVASKAQDFSVQYFL